MEYKWGALWDIIGILLDYYWDNIGSILGHGMDMVIIW